MNTNQILKNYNPIILKLDQQKDFSFYAKCSKGKMKPRKKREVIWKFTSMK